jgi:hypothetical protein
VHPRHRRNCSIALEDQGFLSFCPGTSPPALWSRNRHEYGNVMRISREAYVHGWKLVFNLQGHIMGDGLGSGSQCCSGAPALGWETMIRWRVVVVHFHHSDLIIRHSSFVKTSTTTITQCRTRSENTKQRENRERDRRGFITYYY